MHENDPRPNILLLVMDSTRRDYLSCYGSKSNATPVIDELAEQGAIFERAYATGSWTVPVHGSLFTGKLPSEHGAHAGNNYLSVTREETLAGQLSNSGYDTVGFSTNPWVTEQFGYTEGFGQFFEIFPTIKYTDAGDPRDVDWRFDSGLRKVQERIEWVLSGNPLKRLQNAVDVRNHSSPTCSADTVNSTVSQWLTRRNTDKPFFAFINYMDAHEPYGIHDRYLPEGTSIDDEILDFQWNHGCFENGPAEDEYELVRQIYGAAVSHLDQQIGVLFDHLKDADEFENTVIVVLGDHGQSLGECGYWGHGIFLHEELVNIPLIIRPPIDSPGESGSSELISVAEIPRILGKYGGFDLDDGTTALFSEITQNSNRDESNTAIVESHGPYYDDKPLPDYVSKSGYRSIYFQSWRGTRNLETDEFVVEQIVETDRNDGIDAESVLIEIETEFMENVDSRSRRMEPEDIDNTTKARLQDLGYI